jgi:hypothetical protein
LNPDELSARADGEVVSTTVARRHFLCPALDPTNLANTFYTTGAVVDIAPVFKWSDDGYALPGGDGGWITTDPEDQASGTARKSKSVGQAL